LPFSCPPFNLVPLKKAKKYPMPSWALFLDEIKTLAIPQPSGFGLERSEREGVSEF
jgi:hypothetical protein